MPTRPPVHRPTFAPTPEEARRQYDARRGSPSKRGYGRDWQKVRAAVLAEEPLCRFCMAEARVTEATVVDHVETIEARPDLRLVRSNLRPLCKFHHDQRTGREHTPRPTL